MSKQAFEISIVPQQGQDKREKVVCGTLLRSIPGNRRVYEARWKGREIIAKLFFPAKSWRAKNHAKREWRGLLELRRRGVNAPEPLLLGRTAKGIWVVLIEKVADCKDAAELFDRAQEWSKKLSCLFRVAGELARQHDKGVLQTDTHLGNFLLTTDSVFALDPGQMRFYEGPVPKAKCIEQLASLGGVLPDLDDPPMKGNRTDVCEQLFYAYMSTRCTDINGSKSADRARMKSQFRKQVIRQRNRAVRRGLSKCLRTSKRTLRVETPDALAIVDKQFCDATETEDFIRQIDQLMDSGTVLKNGNTCYVCGLHWRGRNVVVKRYNNKGLVHSFRHTLKGSRARGGWLAGNRLRMLRIPTPKPLAFIEKYKGPLLSRSYLITEQVNGRRLHEVLADENISEHEKTAICGKVARLLDKLGRHRITHGDLKHSNILLTCDGPQLIDLDSMQVHRWGLFWNSRRRKDFARFDSRFFPDKSRQRGIYCPSSGGSELEAEKTNSIP